MKSAATAHPDQRVRLPELVAYRAAAARRRAEAFCDAPEYVLGEPVRPLTPPTFSMLVAVESHFVRGGKPTERDVRDFIWFHSPAYSHSGVEGWQARKAHALRRLNRELGGPWRMWLPRWLRPKLDRERYAAALALAIADIRRLFEDAFADCPAGGDGGAPIATLEAHLVNQFALIYHWAPERTRATPIRQLFQLIRCIRSYRGEDVADAGEQEILAAHLRRRMAAIEAQKKAEGVDDAK